MSSACGCLVNRVLVCLDVLASAHGPVLHERQAAGPQASCLSTVARSFWHCNCASSLSQAVVFNLRVRVEVTGRDTCVSGITKCHHNKWSQLDCLQWPGSLIPLAMSMHTFSSLINAVLYRAPNSISYAHQLPMAPPPFGI